MVRLLAVKLFSLNIFLLLLIISILFPSCKVKYVQALAGETAPFYHYQRKMSGSFKKISHENRYKNRKLLGDPENTRIVLNSDSTFIYYNESKPHDFSVGKYSCGGNLIIFNWDSLMTYKAFHDSSFCFKIFGGGSPIPLKIENDRFIFKSDKRWALNVQGYMMYMRSSFHLKMYLDMA
jgi:hypothetical protein